MQPKLFRLLFWAALLFAFVMAVLPQPPVKVPGPDLSLHLVTFTVLTALAAAAFPRTRLLWIAGLLALFGGLIELVQMIPALGRDSNPVDLLANALGIGLALPLAALWRWRARRT